jgi:hypothetical protein
MITMRGKGHMAKDAHKIRASGGFWCKIEAFSAIGPEKDSANKT